MKPIGRWDGLSSSIAAVCMRKLNSQVLLLLPTVIGLPERTRSRKCGGRSVATLRPSLARREWTLFLRSLRE